MLEISDWLLGLLCLVAGYAFGCFSTAYYVGKYNHIDIRSYGSGNAGTTNAMRTLGKKAGVITYIGDFLKVVLPLFILRYFLLTSHMDLDLFCLILGLGAVLGHNYPFWLKFKGGKGIAVTSGVFVVIAPLISIFLVALFALIALVSKYISLASIITIIFAGFCLMLRYHFTPAYTIVISLYILLALWQHRKNIVRLINGTENKIGQPSTPLTDEERHSAN